MANLLEIEPGDGYRYLALWTIVAVPGGAPGQLFFACGLASRPLAAYYFQPQGYLSCGYYREKMDALATRSYMELAAGYLTLCSLRGEAIGEARERLQSAQPGARTWLEQVRGYAWPTQSG